MHRGRAPLAVSTLVLLVAATFMAGCIGEQNPELTRACGPDDTPKGRIITLGSMEELNEAPGGNFSLNMEAVNEDNCVASFRTQAIHFTFRDEKTGREVAHTIQYTNDTIPGVPGGTTEAKPRGSVPLGNFPLTAPKETGVYIIEVKLEQLGWEGRQRLNVLPEHGAA